MIRYRAMMTTRVRVVPDAIDPQASDLEDAGESGKTGVAEA
jgi:hypothetical protein